MNKTSKSASRFRIFQGQSSGNNSNSSNQSTQQPTATASSSSDAAPTKKPSTSTPNPMKLHWMKMQQLSGNKTDQTPTVFILLIVFVLNLFFINPFIDYSANYNSNNGNSNGNSCSGSGIRSACSCANFKENDSSIFNDYEKRSSEESCR